MDWMQHGQNLAEGWIQYFFCPRLILLGLANHLQFGVEKHRESAVRKSSVWVQCAAERWEQIQTHDGAAEYSGQGLRR